MAFTWFRNKKEDRDDGPDPEAASPAAADRRPEEEKAPPAADDGEGTADETRENDPSEAEMPAAAVPEEGVEEQPEGPETGGLFGRLKQGLSKTRRLLSTDIEDLFTGGRSIDDTLLEELEELLITSDIGVQTSMDLIDTIRQMNDRMDQTEATSAALERVAKNENR